MNIVIYDEDAEAPACLEDDFARWFAQVSQAGALS